MAVDYLRVMQRFHHGDEIRIDGDRTVYENITFLGTSHSKAELDMLWVHLHREDRMAEVDARTAELIAEGFDFNGDHFSLSANAQLNWVTLNSVRDELEYPVAVTSMDGEYLIPNAEILHAFCMTALATAKAYIDSGRQLKVALQDVHSILTMDEIRDER